MSKEPITIMQLTHNMDVGGAEVMIRHLVEGLEPGKYVSSVACIDGEPGAIGQSMREEGRSVLALGRGTGFDRALISAIRRILNAQQIDILHCHQYTPYCYGVLAAIGTRARVIFTEHGRFYPDRFTWKRRLINQLLGRITPVVTTISAATRDALVTYEWFAQRKIQVIYNGVRPLAPVKGGLQVRHRLGISDSAFVLGTLSRLDPIKNQRLMLKALHRIRETVPRAVLLLAGDGPEREALETLTAELGLQDRVVFAGFVSDIADHLDAMNVFLLTSFSEGTSMTLLEAMCLAKPIIATRVGGNVEVIDNQKTGVLIDSDDTDALVVAVERLASDSRWGQQLGEQARQAFHAQFSLHHMVSNYEQLYASLGD
ncbi:glycosyltransferase [Granulosicoccus sp.]|nr:glycosyltransferase [Granulosicoccus sp.]